jgi:hypothetical protein
MLCREASDGAVQANGGAFFSEPTTGAVEALEVAGADGVVDAHLVADAQHGQRRRELVCGETPAASYAVRSAGTAIPAHFIPDVIEMIRRLHRVQSDDPPALSDWPSDGDSTGVFRRLIANTQRIYDESKEKFGGPASWV